MCGLVGLISKNQNGFNRDQQDVFASLLFVDLLRGEDSTGVMTIFNNGDLYAAKDATDSLQFMRSKEFDTLMKKAWNSGSAMIGHNRKATRGSITDKNAHPFNVQDNIVLVHNGTMTSDFKKLAPEGTEVDSHAIAHLIHEKGVEEALNSFSGAYALIYYNVKEASINLIRNDQRPLWWMETPNAWIWSSEKSMLDFVTARNKLIVKEEPAELPEDVLQTFTLKDRKWEVDSKKLKIKKVHTYFSNVGNGGTPAWGRDRTSSAYEEWAMQEYGGGGAEWEHHESDDIREFKDRVRQEFGVRGKPTQLSLPTVPRKNESPPAPPIVEPPEFPGVEKREGEIARTNNKLIDHGTYTSHVLPAYGWGTEVLVSPFDYGYVNGRDNTDGYYLYASPFDDESVILRQFFSKKTSEEYMIQLAGTDYVFEFTVGTKSWSMPNGEAAPEKIQHDTQGVCIIRSQRAKMVYRGTMKHFNPNLAH